MAYRLRMRSSAIIPRRIFMDHNPVMTCQYSIFDYRLGDRDCRISNVMFLHAEVIFVAINLVPLSFTNNNNNKNVTPTNPSSLLHPPERTNSLRLPSALLHTSCKTATSHPASSPPRPPSPPPQKRPAIGHPAHLLKPLHSLELFRRLPCKDHHCC